MRTQYKNIEESATTEQLIEWARDVTHERQFDLEDYDNQIAQSPVIFNSAPSSSSDMTGAEKVGDIAADANFLYVVVDNAGVLEWRRVAISSF